MPVRYDESPSATPTPLTPLSGRKLLSRIKSPFASKVRNITDYLIHIEDPHRQYSPGDIVKGSVRLQVNKPTRITHLVVCLHGFVQVYRTPGSPGDGYRTNTQYLANGRPKKTAGEYFGNGFASLFEDEVVLCGDGRLAENKYQFEFELEFPNRDLPSSIDFERGTISYMITATLTRPTPIAPTMTCDRKVYLVEHIDISPLSAPRSRTITLEPISKRGRAKTQARRLVEQGRKSDSFQQSDETRRNTLPNGSSIVQRDSPGSPSPSEMSFDSLVSSNGRAPHSESHRPSIGTGNSEQSKSSLVNQKTIVATIEMQSGGCLRGDHVSVKIHVSHTKPIKSVHGVILTLYRQARVDMHPAIPLGPTEKGSDAKYEDYYPKSFTGLGGLSLSGAGSSHTFRKDLAQTLAPLYVDPQTLTADIAPKFQVPDGAFPSIATVPGGMISFRYYVEVILDIQGKLGTQDRSLSNLGGLTSTQVQMGGFLNLEADTNSTIAFGTPIIDTAQLRRDKGVVACTFEIIVGTQDSERRKGKRKVEVAPELSTTNGVQHFTADHYEQPLFRSEQEYSEWYDEPDAHYEQYWSPQYASHYNSRSGNGYDQANGWHNGEYDYHHAPLPIPEIPEESQLSEKDRLRRMEERLLPSQPPGAWGPSSPNGHHLSPSAPYLEEEQSHVPGIDITSAPAYETATASAMQAESSTAESSRTLLSPSRTKSTSLFVPGQATSFSIQGGVIEENGHVSSIDPHVPSSADLDSNEHPNGAESSNETAVAVSGSDADESFDSHADARASISLPRYEEHGAGKPG